MTSRRLQTFRRSAGAAQALLVLGLPFVSIGGESALRLDVPGGRLLAFGASFAITEGFVVLAATLLLAAGFLLVTLLFGRVWCGWSCPQTVLGDLTAVALRLRARAARPGVSRAGRAWRAALAIGVLAGVSALFSAAALWYLVSPYEFASRLAAGALGPTLGGAWAVLGGILFLDLALLRERFCATTCPYARLQGVMFDRSTLVVAYDRRRAADCVDCGACVRICPTGIDIRDGLQMECIACAACIDACQPIMARLGRAPDLVRYAHGEPGAPARWLRPGTIALGAVTAASLALLVGTVAGRAVLTLVAQPEAGFAPRRAPDGRVVNAFQVALENRARTPVSVALAARAEGGEGAEIVLRPAEVALAGGEHRSLRVIATARGLAPGRTPAAIHAEVRADGAVLERRSARIPILAPEAR